MEQVQYLPYSPHITLFNFFWLPKLKIYFKVKI